MFSKPKPMLHVGLQSADLHINVNNKSKVLKLPINSTVGL